MSGHKERDRAGDVAAATTTAAPSLRSFASLLPDRYIGSQGEQKTQGGTHLPRIGTLGRSGLGPLSQIHTMSSPRNARGAASESNSPTNRRVSSRRSEESKDEEQYTGDLMGEWLNGLPPTMPFHRGQVQLFVAREDVRDPTGLRHAM